MGEQVEGLAGRDLGARELKAKEADAARQTRRKIMAIAGEGEALTCDIAQQEIGLFPFHAKGAKGSDQPVILERAFVQFQRNPLGFWGIDLELKGIEKQLFAKGLEVALFDAEAAGKSVAAATDEIGVKAR